MAETKAERIAQLERDVELLEKENEALGKITSEAILKGAEAGQKLEEVTRFLEEQGLDPESDVITRFVPEDLQALGGALWESMKEANPWFMLHVEELNALAKLVTIWDSGEDLGDGDE